MFDNLMGQSLGSDFWGTDRTESIEDDVYFDHPFSVILSQAAKRLTFSLHRISEICGRS